MRALRWALACLPLVLAAGAQSPAFEVISVKPNNTDDFRTSRMQVFPGGRFSATALPLLALLAHAYNLPVNPSERLSGVPDWVLRERFDIEARAPEGAFPAGMPSSEARAKMQTMLQVLGEWQQIPELTGRAIGCFFYVLVFGSLMGFVAFNWLLGHVPTAKVGTYAYVNPVIAVFIGWCFGEEMHGWIFAGIAIILVGVYLVRRDHAPSQEI